MNLYYIYSVEQGVRLYRVQFELIDPVLGDFCCRSLIVNWGRFQVLGGRNEKNNTVSISVNVVFIKLNFCDNGCNEIEEVLEGISCCPFCGEKFKMIEQKDESFRMIGDLRKKEE